MHVQIDHKYVLKKILVSVIVSDNCIVLYIRSL